MPVQRISAFDTWRPGYAGATVTAYRAGSSVLANLWLDEAQTIPANNPQTLLVLNQSNQSYGKFSAPIYHSQAIELQIDNIDTTGTIRPALTTLVGVDAGLATVIPSGAVVAGSLSDILSRVVYVDDFGLFLATGQPGASSATNNATLVTAIGAAGAQGGGTVIVPPGVFDVVSFTIPTGVVVEGYGQGATFLQSTYAGPVVSLGGPRAGMRHLTLDGVSLGVNSVGIFSVAADETSLHSLTVKRFETGIYQRGGERADWRMLTVSNCVTGAKLHGDANAGAGGGGEVYQHNRWVGGRVEFNSTAGIEFKRIDRVCAFNLVEGVGFISNTGAALSIIGARSTTIKLPVFSGNTTDLSIADGTPVDVNNTVVGFTMVGGSMVSGAMTLNGTLQDVIFDGVEFAAVAITLTNPLHNVLAVDCREDSAVTLAGQATNWIRSSRTDLGASFGLTTGNAATKAWAISLVSGQQVLLEAVVIGRQRNGVNRAFYMFANSARRAPATLAYDTQTGNFTVGNIVTGGTSGATARLVADADAGATGTLSLIDVQGTFIDNEIITDGATGSAMVNGIITEGATSVGTPVALRTAEESDAAWDAAFVANGPEIELRVTGNSAQTVEWSCDVKVVST